MRAFIAVVLSTAVVFLAAFAGGHTRGQAWIERQLAARVGRQLLTAGDAEVPRIMATLAGHDIAGLPEIIAALASPRDVVADAAAESLQRSLDAWSTLPGPEASQRVAVAARSLAEVAPQLNVRRQQTARQIAQRLLVWPLDSTVVDAVQVLADCETIARACPAARLPVLVKQARPEENALAVESPAKNEPRVEIRQPVLVGRRNDSPQAEPQRFEPLPVEPVEPKRFLPPRAEQMPIPPASEASPTPSEDAAPAEITVAPARFQRESDVEVMRHLHNTDGALVAAAVQELSRRGYRGVHLALARGLTHPDPHERRKLAESLPQMKGIDARPWLQHLAADSDPDVCRAAAAILQTSGSSATAQKRR